MQLSRLLPMIVAMFFAALMLAGGLAMAEPESGGDCFTCHQQSYDRALYKMFIHEPFMRKKCVQCHIGNTVLEPTGQSTPSFIKSSPRIKWLAESMKPRASHWFLIPAQAVDTALVAELTAADGDGRREEIILPNLSRLPKKQDDRKPPLISSLKVAGVEKGIYLSATVVWQTDEIATSTVRYGTGEPLDTVVTAGPLLSRQHRLVLSGLRRNTSYRVEAISADIFGNQTVAGNLSFSTRSASYTPPAGLEYSGAAGSASVKLEYDLEALDGSYLLSLSASQPVSVAVGLLEGEPDRRVTQQGKTKGAKPATHPPTKGKRDTTIVTCYECHGHTKEGMSHPVDIRPKPGMVIPPEYQILPDGRMTCQTCHAGHASDFEYRLIKSGKKELCIGCHKGMI